MTSHVVLLRHGRTALNADGRLRGRLDPDLDEVGRAEAEAAARFLAGRVVDALVTSPLARARQTAEAVGRAACLDVLVDERLLDRDYSDLAGAVTQEVIARYGSLDAAPGVEAHEAVLRRARAALAEHGAGHGTGVVVMVSHDAVITTLLADLGLDPATLVVPTGSLSDLVQVEHRWAVTTAGVLPSP